MDPVGYMIYFFIQLVDKFSVSELVTHLVVLIHENEKKFERQRWLLLNLCSLFIVPAALLQWILNSVSDIDLLSNQDQSFFKWCKYWGRDWRSSRHMGKVVREPDIYRKLWI